MSIRKQYDSDLEALRVALVEMGQNAAEAVENALEALCTADTAAAQKIVQGDDRINNMERDIEHRCMTLLLRQQPVAGDLRHISTAMKVVTDIERMGDHASDIAEIIPHLVTVRKERDPAVSQAIAMGRKAYQMILDAMDALTAEDEIAARRVIAADDAVDYDFNAIKHTLAQEIAADPAKVDAALDLLMVIKYLERIGDHAVNVAEWVQFVRTGRYKDESMFWKRLSAAWQAAFFCGEYPPSQALPRQLSQRESQGLKLVAKVLGETRKLPAVLLAPPSGELARRQA